MLTDKILNISIGTMALLIVLLWTVPMSRNLDAYYGGNHDQINTGEVEGSSVIYEP